MDFFDRALMRKRLAEVQRQSRTEVARAQTARIATTNELQRQVDQLSSVVFCLTKYLELKGLLDKNELMALMESLEIYDTNDDGRIDLADLRAELGLGEDGRPELDRYLAIRTARDERLRREERQGRETGYH
jgi:hypothetical protein